MSAGKGMTPEKGRDLKKYRSNFSRIDWGKKPKVDPDWLDVDDDGEEPEDTVIQTPPDRR